MQICLFENLVIVLIFFFFSKIKFVQVIWVESGAA